MSEPSRAPKIRGMTLNYIFTFIFGTVIGSFLNVCILRLPQDQSIVRPRSHCPQCGTLIKAYDNIPILSYLILRGRCRSCKTPISILYPFVEMLTGVLFLLCVMAFGFTMQTLKYAVFISGTVVLIFSDLKFRLLPNEITLYGVGAGLLFSLFSPLRDSSLQSLLILLSIYFHRLEFWLPWAGNSLLNSLVGAVFGAGVLFVVGEFYFRIRHVEGMGMGDVKMMGMVGAFIGIKMTFMTILIGSLVGSIFGVLIMVRRHGDMQSELPFGTFLGSAAVLLALYGRPIMDFVFP